MLFSHRPLRDLNVDSFQQTDDKPREMDHIRLSVYDLSIVFFYIIKPQVYDTCPLYYFLIASFYL